MPIEVRLRRILRLSAMIGQTASSESGASLVHLGLEPRLGWLALGSGLPVDSHPTAVHGWMSFERSQSLTASSRVVNASQRTSGLKTTLPETW